MGEVDLARVTVERDVRVRRRDGVGLRADVYQPPGTGARPTLVMRLPYDKAVAQSYWYRVPAWYAAQGYAVVVEDVRGRGASEGLFAPLVHELDDGVDLVRWTLDQPWCDGSIGLYGYSYSGFLQLLVASSEVGPSVRAIAPALAFRGLGEGCLRTSGVTAIGFLLSWAAELGGIGLDESELRDLRSTIRLPLDVLERRVAPEHASWVSAWLREDPGDAYWAQLPTLEYGRISAAVLGFGGWYDTFRRSSFAHHESLVTAGKDPLLVVGPWSHQPLLSAERGEPIRPHARAWDVDAEQLRFFDAHLRGGPSVATGVRLAILNSDDTWEAGEWPPPTRRVVTYWLDSSLSGRSPADLTLNPSPPRLNSGVAIGSDPADPVPARGGDDCGDPAIQGMGPAWQDDVESRDDVLVYTAPSADAETVLVGTATVELLVEARAPETQWVARLAVVLKDGRSVNLVETVTRVSTRGASVVAVRLELGEFAVRLERGQRLRLHLASTCSPRWAGLAQASSDRVLHGPDLPSQLILAIAA